MAALANFTAYRSRLLSPRQVINVNKTTLTVVAGRPYDLFTLTGLAGSIPSTAVAPDRTTIGALGGTQFENAGTEELFCLGASIGPLLAGTYYLCDRLSHQGGLDGTVTTANLTTNLPTAALTRYTSGDGVMAAVSIYTQIGATGTTISCNYTDEGGNSSTSPLMPIGNTGFREANRMLLLPLATGDTGVRAINNSTLTATTGTAGNFGYTLFKPLMSFTVDRAGNTVDFSIIDGGMGGGLPVIQDDACLFWMMIGAGTSMSFGATTPFTAV